MSKQKILIVEDEDDMRLALEIRLRSAGYDTVLASDGKLAVQMARSRSPNLILLDIGLPSQDGFAVLEELDRDFELGKIPVVILTGRDSHLNQQRSMDGGAYAVLQKPIDDDLLQGTIKKALSSYASRWPGELLQQLIFTYTQEDLIFGKTLNMTHGMPAMKVVLIALTVLSCIGSFALLVLQGHIAGFLLCISVGLGLFLSPHLFLHPLARFLVWRELRKDDTLSKLPHRVRFFAEDGISVEHSGGYKRIPWNKVTGYHADETSSLIFFEDRFLNLPFKVFKSPREREGVMHIIQKFSTGHTAVSSSQLRSK